MDGWNATEPAKPARGIKQPHVYSSHDIFDVAVDKLGKTAVIYDDVGHYEAVAVAEYLVKHGVAVTFITRHPQLAPKMAMTFRLEPALQRLNKGTFDLVTRARIVEVGSNFVRYVPLQGEREVTVAADSMVYVADNHPLNEIYDSLIGDKPVKFKLKRIGDALSPRDLQAAIAEGHMAGRFVAA